VISLVASNECHGRQLVVMARSKTPVQDNAVKPSIALRKEGERGREREREKERERESKRERESEATKFRSSQNTF